MSRAARNKPDLKVAKGKELPLSSDSLLVLLQGVLSRGVPFRFQAKGFSMSPLIRDGDVLTVSPINDGRIRLGDIVAFVSPANGKLAVHRVVGIENGQLEIKGDNVDERDGFIPEKKILGVVTSAERRGRKIRLGLGAERSMIAFLSSRGLARLPLSVIRFLKRLCFGKAGK
ncbi:MAG: S24/S26 family peptidase [Candidatus Aminicenantales bacterium]